MTDSDIQQLVDDHARFGMGDNAIRDHLWAQHGVELNTPIPFPSKAAKRDRDEFLSTGLIRNLPTGAEILSRSQEKESQIDETSSVQSKASLDSLQVTSYLQEESNWRDSDSKLFGLAYRGSGSTLLDRIIHGFAPFIKELTKLHELTNFEMYRKVCIEGSSHFGYQLDTSPLDKIYNNLNLFEKISAPLLSWFKDGVATPNIQIDADLAELFLEARKSAPNIVLPKDPFYIDIRERVMGQRTLSGIFCWPVGDSIGFMAVIEWTGQGYEAFVFGELGKPETAYATYPGDENDPRLSHEQAEAIYGKIPQQVEQIVAMSHQYLRTMLTEKGAMSELNVVGTDRTNVPVNSKKERNKEKTHSYFRVTRIDTPKDLLTHRKKQVCKSWSLDQIITVNGHLRWQPYGERNLLRKLIWIDSYDKGDGGRHRPDSNPELVAINRQGMTA